MKKYNVWSEVECIDEDAGTYDDMECPRSITEFNTLKEAVAFQEMLHEEYSNEVRDARRMMEQEWKEEQQQEDWDNAH